MKASKYKMLSTISSNLLSASEIVSDAKDERLSKPLLKNAIDRAIALVQCSLEALKDNKDNLFD